jgi:hypothetical protein
VAGDTAILTFLAKTILGLREPKESPEVNVSVNAAASVASEFSEDLHVRHQGGLKRKFRN